MHRVWRSVNSVRKASRIQIHPAAGKVKDFQKFQFRLLSSSSADAELHLGQFFPKHDDFTVRHIGPNAAEKKEMLDFIGVEVCAWRPPLFCVGASGFAFTTTCLLSLVSLKRPWQRILCPGPTVDVVVPVLLVPFHVF